MDGDVTMEEKRDNENEERRKERKKRRERKERKGRVERRCREGNNTREDEEPTANHGMEGEQARERKTREKEADGKQMICLDVSELLFWMRCGERICSPRYCSIHTLSAIFLQCAVAAYHTVLYG